ncbi:MAG: 30S ribosomal protein S20 [Gammaproteobacteria bacterium]|nr:30S ribosomal protein S20 [Gammaproteobacteria bacterium]
MANTAQARKRVKQANKRRTSNMSQRSSMRTSIKQFIKNIETNNVDQAKAQANEMFSKIDNMAGKKLIHANKAARLKKRLNLQLKKATQA